MELMFDQLFPRVLTISFGRSSAGASMWSAWSYSETGQPTASLKLCFKVSGYVFKALIHIAGCMIKMDDLPRPAVGIFLLPRPLLVLVLLTYPSDHSPNHGKL